MNCENGRMKISDLYGKTNVISFAYAHFIQFVEAYMGQRRNNRDFNIKQFVIFKKIVENSENILTFSR